MTAVAQAPLAARPATQGKVTQARVLKSEWIKFRTLRSTFWSLFVASGAMIGIAVLFSAIVANKYPHMSALHKADVDPITGPLNGTLIGQLAVGTLGVLVITGEYSTGMIRASLSAVPRRLPVLWAKALVFAVVVWIVMTATSFVCFLAGNAILSSQHIQASLSTPGAFRVVAGTGLYLTVVGLLGVGLGAIIRSTAGGVSALFGILLVLPVLGRILNFTSFGDKVNPYLPSNAGQQIMATKHEGAMMQPWPGFALFVGYAVLTMAVAAYLMKRRDA